MNLALLIPIFISLLQMKTKCELLPVEVDPQEEVMLQEGETFTSMCHVNHSIVGCYWYLNFLSDHVYLQSEQFETPIHTDCRLIIKRVTEKHNGILYCSLHYRDDKGSYTLVTEGNFTLIILKPPKVVHINVIKSDAVKIAHSTDTFEENQEVTFECKIEFGRPEATISWFIERELISDSIYTSLSDTVTEDLGSLYDGEKRVRQNLTRWLKKSDNGEDLKCIANHSALGQKTLLHSVFKLNVYFEPTFGISQQYAFTIGKSGIVVVTIIHANPKPNVTWLIDNDTILEGNTDATGQFHAEYLMSAKEDLWQAVLNISKVRPEDVGKNYSLIAENILGKKKYKPIVSACSAPTFNITPCPALSINFTAWPILAIASAIFLILMVSSILIYLKSDRNWRSDVEIPDFNTYRSFDVVTKGEMENKIRMRKTL